MYAIGLVVITMMETTRTSNLRGELYNYFSKEDFVARTLDAQ